ncbi:MAG: tRNA (adenosine(37)-N6)-dimethylallyltransferase MiaA [Phycisphaerae bacterium]
MAEGNSPPTKLLVLPGPTASGKSALALELARRLGGEILSVDSMQVYRGMNVGTAKPTDAERRQVVHHGIDLCPPTDDFTVARFVSHAQEVIADAGRRSVWLVAAGGTPLYFKALFEGLFEGPAQDPALRERLTAQGGEALHRRLSDVDPAAAARLHANDLKRLVRALEVYELTGKPISAHQQEWGGAPRYAAQWFGLAWEREQLNRRINARCRQMIEAGWVQEVRGLLAAYGELGRSAQQAAGYAALARHVKGQLPLDDAVEQTKIDTRQLARRQIKWFRRFGQVTWLPGDAAVTDNADRIMQAVQAG